VEPRTIRTVRAAALEPVALHLVIAHEERPAVRSGKGGHAVVHAGDKQAVVHLLSRSRAHRITEPIRQFNDAGRTGRQRPEADAWRILERIRHGLVRKRTRPDETLRVQTGAPEYLPTRGLVRRLVPASAMSKPACACPLLATRTPSNQV